MIGEEYFYNLCKKGNIPSSNVVALNIKRNIIDRDYMIVDYIESVVLSSISDEAVKKQIYSKCGAITKKMHSIKGESFGRLANIAKGIIHNTWFDYLKYEVSQWVETVSKYDLYNQETIENVVNILEKYKELFYEIKVPYLVHADLWEGNVLVSTDNNENHVAAIIDGDRAIFGDIDYEFASCWMLTDDFYKGYGQRAFGDYNSNIRKKVYLIIFYVIDSYIWKVQYDNEDNYLSNKNKAIDLINELK